MMGIKEWDTSNISRGTDTPSRVSSCGFPLFLRNFVKGAKSPLRHYTQFTPYSSPPNSFSFVPPVEEEQRALIRFMATMLRVLIVEDSEEDALLFTHELQRGDYEPISQRVDCAEAMSAALVAQQWDLILSDYSMPQFSGPDALALCRQHNLDIPFIVISGRIGEETAVKMMKAGAHDYLMKHQLARLVPAVKRELIAAQERAARRDSETARAHLASIVESCDDAIISKALDGTILSWNRGAERMYGYRAQVIIGRSISVLIPAGRQHEMEEIRELVEQGECMDRLETVRLRQNGESMDVSVTISPIKDADGKICGASIVSRDITERKRQENERVKLIQDLQAALARVHTLGGLLPICASCKKIRNDHGYWEQVEIYIKNRSNAEFTHGICPDCITRLYPEYAPQPRQNSK
jgi:PAS domain S-box-containing protein